MTNLENNYQPHHAIMAAINNMGTNFMFASDAIRNDPSVLMAASANTGTAITSNVTTNVFSNMDIPQDQAARTRPIRKASKEDNSLASIPNRIAEVRSGRLTPEKANLYTF